MSRHSQHANDRSFYSHQERKDAGYGFSTKEVLGGDAFLPFGYCALSLKPPKNPVTTPDGHVYDREFILESLLNQKLELAGRQKLFEEQERKKARKEQQERQQERQKEIDDFQKADQGLLSDDMRHKKALDLAEENRHTRALQKSGKDPLRSDDRLEQRLRDGELLVLDKSKLREKSFWAKENAPNAPKRELSKVDTATRCPMSGKKLRVKDLLPIKLEALDQKMLEAGGGRGVFCCAVSKHPITHQQAVLLKPSGIVVLESVLKDCVLPEMKCPITGKKLNGKEDILKLQQGGTGFSAHNNIEARAYNTIRSRASDDLRHQGHLPKAGYVGLV